MCVRVCVCVVRAHGVCCVWTPYKNESQLQLINPTESTTLHVVNPMSNPNKRVGMHWTVGFAQTCVQTNKYKELQWLR